ncbi:FGGY-family carbohydrate kinase [Hydrogenovibrio sp. JE_KL2]|uniref:FGGY-family carbohydrate kinase n=1 Tax=Hydrogenovibrio sp. JE_KL2 TaxID=2651188 RepID=UPI00156291A2|nr:FGGY-family carbohydrate kinase [Hydrogenovibrio sp. JE_KL2]
MDKVMDINGSLIGNILGLDVGTSGIRATVVSPTNVLLHTDQEEMPFPTRDNTISEQSPAVWEDSLKRLLKRLQLNSVLPEIKYIVADATSSTVLLMDDHLTPLTPALMYDDKRAVEQATKITEYAPTNSAAHGSSSTLAKVMWLEESLQQKPSQKGYKIAHQIDWVNSFFTQASCPTDANNALKLGFDPVENKWPDWVQQLVNSPLPEVVMPGTVIGKLSPAIADTYGFSNEVQVLAGTTDSIAAFLASGAKKLGDATTSLGSTLCLKLLTDKPIFSPEHGIYSHILGDLWLVGGASNTGGAVLLKYFTLPEIIQLLDEIDINQPTNLDYYPLLTPGERFPIANSDLQPKVSPRPSDDQNFLLALIEGLVGIEKLGYELLEQLSSTQIQTIYTAGGGTKNTAWMALRANRLGYKTKKAAQTDAAFGVTQLLFRSFGQ